MNSFYSVDELQGIGFKSIGDNVLLSRKASIYGADKITIGNNVRIDDFCILSGYIELGNYIHISAYAALYGGNDGIFVDDYVSLSSRVTVYAISDDYSGGGMANPMIPDEYKKMINAPVNIKRHVLVGSTSVVLPGVILEEGSSFGAFSFINHSSEPWSLNAGTPYKKIKERKKDLLELEQQFRYREKN